jgi:hypothetical protein
MSATLNHNRAARVYDVGRNLGWASVGIDHDTASLAGKHPPLAAAHGSAALSEGRTTAGDR